MEGNAISSRSLSSWKLGLIHNADTEDFDFLVNSRPGRVPVRVEQRRAGAPRLVAVSRASVIQRRERERVRDVPQKQGDLC